MAETREAEAQSPAGEMDGVPGTEPQTVGAPVGRGSAARAGRARSAARGGPLPTPIPGAASAAAEFPSYQVTAGFASFSLARLQPIRRQRRCSRAGGPETRAPSPDTQRSTRTHNRNSSHTHTVPGTRSIAPTRAHHHRDTHTDVHTPGARRDPRHRRGTPNLTRQTQSQDLHEHCPHPQPQRHTLGQHTTASTRTCSLYDLVPRTHSIRDTHTHTRSQ